MLKENKGVSILLLHSVAGAFSLCSIFWCFYVANNIVAIIANSSVAMREVLFGDLSLPIVTIDFIQNRSQLYPGCAHSVS